MTALPGPGLRSFPEVLTAVALAEQGPGWLAVCAEEGRYVVPNGAFVEALSGVLRQLGEPVLEVCAGDGSLARALRSRGISLTATDATPPEGADPAVEAVDAAAALRRHRHPVVLGSFVPIDSGVDERVLGAPHVRHYLILDARYGPEVGRPPRPGGGAGAGWRRVPLPEVSRWMVTRHDAWLGDGVPVLRRGEAWLLSRGAEEASP